MLDMVGWVLKLELLAVVGVVITVNVLGAHGRFQGGSKIVIMTNLLIGRLNVMGASIGERTHLEGRCRGFLSGRIELVAGRRLVEPMSFQIVL